MRHLLLVFAPVALVLPLHAETNGILRTLAAVRQVLDTEEPREGSFDVTGTVTRVPTSLDDQFALTDGSFHSLMTDGVYWPKDGIRVGDRIRASGSFVRSGMGGYNYARADKIDILAHGEAPVPATATAAEINSGSRVHQVVRVQGTVIDVFRDELDPRYVHFVLFSEKDYLYANAHFTGPDAEVTRLIGATVTLTGLCPKLYRLSTRKVLGPQVQLTVPDDIRVLKPAPADPFDAPDLTGGIREIRTTTASEAPWRKICGTVLALGNGNYALVRTPAGDISRIQFSAADLPACGDSIEAVGIPETDLNYLNLSRAIWRMSDVPATTAAAVEPVTATHLLTDDKGRRQIKFRYHGKTIRLRGIVRHAAADSNNRLMTLECGAFDVDVDLSSLSVLPDVGTGCEVEVTGICSMLSESWRPQQPFPHFTGFVVLARSPDDIRIISYPPWWTPVRLATVIIVLVIAILAVVVWNILLQRLSDRKGRALARATLAKSESELKVQERTRLATELHDSVVQNLTGVSMELRTTRRLFDSKREEARENLSLALKTLNACRDELRNCIWDLRSRALDEPLMDQAIRRTLTPHVSAVEVAVRFAVPRKCLPDNTAHSIICIIRELVLNALRHGHATRIQIAGCLDRERLLFSVRDNGGGFDPESAPGANDGHFGLQGIRERLDALGGEMSISSTPGAGTKVSLSVTLPNGGNQ